MRYTSRPIGLRGASIRLRGLASNRNTNSNANGET